MNGKKKVLNIILLLGIVLSACVPAVDSAPVVESLAVTEAPTEFQAPTADAFPTEAPALEPAEQINPNEQIGDWLVKIQDALGLTENEQLMVVPAGVLSVEALTSAPAVISSVATGLGTSILAVVLYREELEKYALLTTIGWAAVRSYLEGWRILSIDENSWIVANIVWYAKQGKMILIGDDAIGLTLSWQISNQKCKFQAHFGEELIDEKESDEPCNPKMFLSWFRELAEKIKERFPVYGDELIRLATEFIEGLSGSYLGG